MKVKNNVAWYCLRDNINTYQELALLIGSSYQEAKDYIEQTTTIPSNYVTELCRVFKCTPSELLCVEE